MFSPGALVFPHHKTCILGLSPVSTLDQGPGSESVVVPGHCTVAAHCSSGIQRIEHISLYTGYVTNKVPLPLPLMSLEKHCKKKNNATQHAEPTETACRGSLPNACTPLCDALALFNTSIQHL